MPRRRGDGPAMTAIGSFTMKFVELLVVSLITALGTIAASAQPFPTKPIKIIVSSTPGGATDIMARILGHYITARTGQPHVIDNRSGASGNIAMEAVAKAAPVPEPASGGESEIPCPACGTMISADAIMCYACGHRLHDESAPEEVTESDGESEIPCPACGTMISGDAIMCYACGHRLGGDDEKGAKKAPMSVKKVLKKKVM